jgi:hypothetical protein
VTLLENELRGLPERVGALETQVTRVVVQVAEFREEVRAEFSDVRGEFEQFRDDVRAQCAAVRGEFTQFRNEVKAEFGSVQGEMSSMRDELRSEIKNGDDETRRRMRVLHEDLVARISLIDRR